LVVVGELDPFPGQELTPELLAAVDAEEAFAPGLNGAPDVRVLLYRPKQVPPCHPLIVNLHGGAFALRADNFPASAARLAMLGATVVSVDYRPATEAPCCRTVWLVTAATSRMEMVGARDVAAGVHGVVSGVQVVGVGPISRRV